MKYIAAAVLCGLWIGAFFSLAFTWSSAGFLAGMVLVFLPLLAGVMAMGISFWKESIT